MRRHFDDELKKIKDKLFRMGLMVEQSIARATQALFQRDNSIAEEVIRKDRDINIEEMEIDELGHELIALYQPAAKDLRLLTMILKLTNDLERMGDQAVNIAQSSLVINQNPPLKTFDKLPGIADAVRQMVRGALGAFIEKDAEKATQVLESNDAVDNFNDRIFDEIQAILEAKPQSTRIGVAILMISHNLERIADLATNIAEEVIYLERGVDIRHHIRERRDDPEIR